MRTTSIRAARRDASSICSKAEANIVHLSSPEAIKRLSESQLLRQIRLSEKAYQRHRDNYNRVSSARRKSRLEPGYLDPIRLKMSLMEDSQRRFERQLRLFKDRTASERPARRVTARPAAARAEARRPLARATARPAARTAARPSGRRRAIVAARGRTPRAQGSREIRVSI